MTFSKIGILGLLLLTSGSLLISSCSSKHDEDQQDNFMTIRLTSNVDMLSRSSLQNTQLESGQEVGFFVKKSSPAVDVLYSNQKLIADGSGNFSYSTSMFYPISNENVDFYAYHPFETGSLLENSLLFSVKANQSIKANYLNSDLLYAKKLDIAKTSSAVPLKFYHQLTKLNFTIKEGSGMNLSGMTTVEVLNLKPTITMSLANGSISSASGSLTPIAAYGVQGTAVGETEVNGISAIVVPQTAAKGNKLFKITLNSGTANEISYYYTPNADITFENGKKYNFILTINHAGITVTSSIEDWASSGDPIEGEGSID